MSFTKEEVLIGDKVLATMDGKSWFRGKIIEVIDLFAPYRVKLENGEVRVFVHVVVQS